MFNKVYCRSIDTLIEKIDTLDITPQEKEALRLLTRDINLLKLEKSKKY